jgi:hypothetical protein
MMLFIWNFPKFIRYDVYLFTEIHKIAQENVTMMNMMIDIVDERVFHQYYIVTLSYLLYAAPYAPLPSKQ